MAHRRNSWGFGPNEGSGAGFPRRKTSLAIPFVADNWHLVEGNIVVSPRSPLPISGKPMTRRSLLLAGASLLAPATAAGAQQPSASAQQSEPPAAAIAT